MNAAARIEEAFDALGTVMDRDGKWLTAPYIDVPFCDYKGRAGKTSLHDVIVELLADGQKPVMEAVFTMLAESTCPHVRALRHLMCSQWVRSHADELEAAWDVEAAL
jgi:hypothetical protein